MKRQIKNYNKTTRYNLESKNSKINVSDNLLFSRHIDWLSEQEGISFSYLLPSCMNIKELIKCAICLNIINNVKACSICLNGFCSYCIDIWLKTNKNCPCCKSTFENDEKIVRQKNNILDTCQYYCVNHQNGCQKTFNSQKSFFNHFKNECIHGKYECNSIIYSYNLSPINFYHGRKCTFKGNLNEIKIHSKNCGLKEIMCRCCEKKFPLIVIKQHCDDCYNKLQLCQYCHLNFPHIQLKSHYLECPEIEINCVKCKQKFLRKNKNNHSDIQCLENRYSAIMRDNLDLKKEVNQLKTKVKDLEEIINTLKNNEKNKN